jgi:transposase
MRPPTPPLSLSDGQQEILQALARSSTATHREVVRARVLLLAAEGVANTAIAKQVGVAPSTIAAWRARFVEDGLAAIPKGLAVHLILDNYATHNHPNVTKWLAKHPRFHLHFTPTSSSWLNLVERFYRELTQKALRRGVFASVPQLIAAVEDYLQATNDDPKPFVWTATAESILTKVRRGRVVLESISS